MRIAPIFLILSLCASVAQANTTAADACKEKLSPIGQEIYTTSLAQHPTKETGKSIVTSEVEKLISDGKLSMLDGRKEGEAAGDCLKLLQ
jgi:hypothetical protein